MTQNCTYTLVQYSWLGYLAVTTPEIKPMKISLLIEKDDRHHELSVNCCVQGLSAVETKERLADLMTSVDKVLSQERLEESGTLPIRRGVCF